MASSLTSFPDTYSAPTHRKTTSVDLHDSSLTSFPDTYSAPTHRKITIVDLHDSSLIDRLYSKVKTGLQRSLSSPTSPAPSVLPPPSPVSIGLPGLPQIHSPSPFHTPKKSVPAHASTPAGSIQSSRSSLDEPRKEKINVNRARNHLEPVLAPVTVSSKNPAETLNLNRPTFTGPPPPSQPIFTKVMQHLPGFALEREPSSESESQSINFVLTPQTTVLHVLDRLKTGHLGREYWMKNENCHACFLCDSSFTAWRRKHHCRICGQIFCSKCTAMITGGRFRIGNSSQFLRVCKTCLQIMDQYHETDDNFAQPPQSLTPVSSYSYDTNPFSLGPDQQPVSTPMMAIPATRVAGDDGTNTQHRTVEFPAIHDVESGKPRPSSSKSFSARSRLNVPATYASGRHKWAFANDDFVATPAPFRRYAIDEDGNFPTVHPHSIVDPELAPYMSDEEAEDDPSISLFSAIMAKPADAVSIAESTRLGRPPRVNQRRNNSRLRIAASDVRSNVGPVLQNTRRNTISQARPVRAKSKSLIHRLSTSLQSLDNLKLAAAQNSTTPIKVSRPIAAKPVAGPTVELNAASLQHLRRLLIQLLQEITPEPTAPWEDALMPILLKISDTIRPDVRNGDDLDIRHYAKIKRISGGSPKDTRYINGIVFTKNLALKRMSRSIDSPRIVIIAFPIEYHREEPKLMSLEPVIAQEHEYLRNLVNRIIALRPHIVLVEGSVSGIALKFLDEANIAVAYNVKMPVLQAVARLTQAHIIASIDRLAFGPKVGKCSKISVRTYLCDDFPGHKKSFMWLEGCREELGCTVILRGASMDFLTNVKRVLDFMVFAVNNLKLETALIRDQFALLPVSVEVDPTTESTRIDHKIEFPLSRPGSRDKAQSAIAKFDATILSVSPVVKFPVPYLLQFMLDSSREAYSMKDNGVNQSLEVLHPIEDALVVMKQVAENYIPVSLDTQWKDILEITIRNALRTSVFKKAMHLLMEREKQWTSFLSQTPDILSPLVHQNLVVLFSTVCSVTAVPCQGPEIHAIEYYRESDCALGQYVEDMSFESHAICTANGCDKRSFEHYRCYVHGDARVSVVLEKVPSPLPGMQESILMWSYCKICKLNLPVTAMPENTWKYSFGKFLELSFYDTGLKTRAGMCPHNINRDHLRYFGYQNWAVRFEYDSIQLFGVSVPNLTLEWKLQSLLVSKFEEYNLLEGRISRFFDSVEKRCKSIRTDKIPADKIEPCQSEILRLQKLSLEDRQLLHSQLRETFVNSGIRDSLSLSKAFRGLQERVIKWDRYFADLDDRFFLSDKDIRHLTAMQFRKLFAERDSPYSSETTEKPSFEIESEITTVHADEKDLSESSRASPVIVPEEETLADNLVPKTCPTDGDKTDDETLRSDSIDTPLQTSGECSPESHTRGHGKLRQLSKLHDSSLRNFKQPGQTLKHPERSPVRKVKEDSLSKPRQKVSNVFTRSKPKHGEGDRVVLANSQDHFPPPKARFVRSALAKQTRLFPASSATKVSSLTRHFNKLSEEFEQQKARERKVLRASIPRSLPIGPCKPMIEVFSNSKGAEDEHWDDEDEDIQQDSAPNLDPLSKNKPVDECIEILSPIGPYVDGNQMIVYPPDSTGHISDSELAGPCLEKSSFMKTLTNFLADRSAATWSPLEPALAPSEHLFADSDVVVREDEPSSLIAFTLASPAYLNQISSMRTSPRELPPVNELESILLKGTATHMKCEVQDGESRMVCKVFYAEQFEAFRQQCGCSETFIQSLARCKKWDSSGGKSDNRFILKGTTRLEIESFMKFAPCYFEFMAQAFFHELPTALAKIMGFYQIHTRSSSTGKTVKMNIMVMENLFYDRKVSRIFDLKGSMRNRHVESTGKENEVLLDENLVEFIYESPLFIREHSKRLLRASLWNDTLFLAKVNVMDYSLVIGIDDEQHELVVGIIERTRGIKNLKAGSRREGLLAVAAKSRLS
ncbi:1-phosphatidylinositol 3-phosphate 5-kinase fab1 [Neolecta irregularis DAH-3]|uniref:1-phosphatidylinositol-3-phosphate 5-kinase n=1 Tax=Neolecta irregularis (strain DAH-3) TaxID=1198029 RepID=A0A1U7LL77_NEOID|nr:1-phosphatidylinositol 3-phosphate 5-kinase fab1 [Neolecta irregularis DAH-3]|eukprot:OLL23388.1 1-phosphatidylinositol 3-phosphate 5-kinase fab1 [Neolecta irregularis DAH-3]